ncbi:MAG TPA: hypothetical protein VH593_18500 [Ktedonobacteraceae bacterium]
MLHTHDPNAHIQHEILPNGLSVFAKEVDAPWIYGGFVCHVGPEKTHWPMTAWRIWSNTCSLKTCQDGPTRA